MPIEVESLSAHSLQVCVLDVGLHHIHLISRTAWLEQKKCWKCNKIRLLEKSAEEEGV